MSGFLSRSRARVAALALAVGVVGCLAVAPASMAAAPLAGANCQAQDGKISGRGSTLQVWLQYAFAGAYTNDVCGGGVAADSSADNIGNTALGVDNDVTDPGSAFYSLPDGTSYARNWMLNYDNASAQALGSAGSNAATGSGAGETAIGCDAEAFSGTDIPVTMNQYNAIDSPPTVSGSNYVDNGKNCNPVNVNAGLALQSPFAPFALGQSPGTPGVGTADAYPNPGDTFTGQQVMLFPIGVSAVAQFVNLPTACLNANTTTKLGRLSTADMQGIWGGTYSNWNQIAIYSGVAACNIPITRVVRSDNSGTTQSFDNYMADAFGYSTATCDTNAAHFSNTFGQLQNNQAQAQNSDAYWPGTGGKISVPAGDSTFTYNTISGCSPVEVSANAGGPALIDLAETVNGAIGYADYSDVIHDTNSFVSAVTGNSMKVELVQNASATTTYANPISSKASNCSTTNASLPGSSSDDVNLAQGSSGGDWDLQAQSTANSGPDDITWNAQTPSGSTNSSYPICSLTWDFVWAGEDGNTPPAPTAAADVTLPATQIAISSVAGVPDQGSFDVVDGSGSTTTQDGSPQSGNVTLPVTSLELASTAGMPYSGTITVDGQTLTYTGISGNVLTGVSGGTSGTVFAANGTAVTVPQAYQFTYTGIGTSTAADGGTVTPGGGTTGTGCTSVPAPCLTGVSGPASGSFTSGSALVFPQGTGGPEANLTADQRRTEYSYYTYLMSPEAQSKATAAYYTALPASFLPAILNGFQTNF